MIVVADTSPIIALWKIQALRLLPALFEKVVIPGEVDRELRRPEYADASKGLHEFAASWLLVREPEDQVPILGIDLGESCAIRLAEQLDADLLLMDDRDGVKTARGRGLKVTGTVGLLENADERGLIDLESAFKLLAATNFRVTWEYLEGRLLIQRKRSGGSSDLQS